MPEPNRAPPGPGCARLRRKPPLPLALLSLALMQVHGAWAQSGVGDDAPLVLQRTPMLAETIAPAERAQRPSIIEGDRVSGRPDLETIVEGNASLRRGDTVIHADRLEYYQPDDLAKATGRVRVNQAGNVYEGPQLELKVETFEGFFNNVRYKLLASGGHGEADRVDFVDADRAIARRATYTTCRREDFPGWVPAWFLSAANLRTDSQENVGTAEQARLTFMGLSTPPIPSVSFPLNNERKSGLLPPTFGMDSVNGLELSLPFYWNIAPNRDATFTPTVMSKRGVNLSNEFRFLEKGYRGDVRLDLMPSDTLPASRRAEAISDAMANNDYKTANTLAARPAARKARWGLWGNYRQEFDVKSIGLDGLNLNLNLNRVSDNDYWRDFGRTPTLSTRLLPNSGALSWTQGDWNGQVRMLSYQTLQYSASPIVPPYDRLPQLTANYVKYDWNGFDVSLNTDFSRFRANTVEQGQPNADRAYALASLSRPFVTPGAYITPKVQLHTTTYQFDGALSNGRTSASRTVPTFSLNSGMTFERDVSLFGRAFRQTLEPRAFYVYTPYRDQSRLPVYDTASNDFSFATLFSENEFSGNDRISSTNALTMGLTSRLLDPDTGSELARFGIAQRRRFSDQRVTMPTLINTVGGATFTMPGSSPVTERSSDLLLGALVNLSPKWSLDTTVQYNPDDRRSSRSTITARYTPGPYRTLSASYRYQADRISSGGAGNESIDIGWQWPINDLWGDTGKDLGPGRGQGGGRWYIMGRLNYSLRDKPSSFNASGRPVYSSAANKPGLTDALIGLEYDGCCYIGRIVLEKTSTGLATSTKRIMFQIEFLGLSSLGSNPMRTLRLNVPRYQPLRAPIAAPSRFTNYD